MQAVGATQPGLHGESKDIKTPLLRAHPKPLPNRPPRRRVCALQVRENRRGLLSGFSLSLTTGPWGDFLL